MGNMFNKSVTPVDDTEEDVLVELLAQLIPLHLYFMSHVGETNPCYEDDLHLLYLILFICSIMI